MSLRNQLIRQFKLNMKNPRSEEFLAEITEQVKNISFFKLQNCKFCTNKVCLMIKKGCLFYDKITGKNYQFFKCKYFKRAYIRAENEQILKSFDNMLFHLFLRPDFDKGEAKIVIDGSRISFSVKDIRTEYSLDDDSYSNILFKIKDILIEKFGYYDPSIKFKLVQLNKYEVKFELDGEIFIYGINDKYQDFVDLCKTNPPLPAVIEFIKNNFKFWKSSQLMNISKEMKALYDSVHCHSMIHGMFKDISSIEMTYSRTRSFMNQTILSSNDKSLTVYGIGIGGTLTDLYYLISILVHYGFYFRVEDLLVHDTKDDYKVKLFKDKLPEVEDVQF